MSGRHNEGSRDQQFSQTTLHRYVGWITAEDAEDAEAEEHANFRELAHGKSGCSIAKETVERRKFSDLPTFSEGRDFVDLWPVESCPFNHPIVITAAGDSPWQCATGNYH